MISNQTMEKGKTVMITLIFEEEISNIQCQRPLSLMKLQDLWIGH